MTISICKIIHTTGYVTKILNIFLPTFQSIIEGLLEDHRTILDICFPIHKVTVNTAYVISWRHGDLMVCVPVSESSGFEP